MTVIKNVIRHCLMTKDFSRWNKITLKNLIRTKLCGEIMSERLSFLLTLPNQHRFGMEIVSKEHMKTTLLLF